MKSFKRKLEYDFDNCEYCVCTYSEYDTGYKEFGCSLLGYPKENSCLGDECCPLSASYEVSLD